MMEAALLARALRAELGLDPLDADERALLVEDVRPWDDELARAIEAQGQRDPDEAHDAEELRT